MDMGSLFGFILGTILNYKGFTTVLVLVTRNLGWGVSGYPELVGTHISTEYFGDFAVHKGYVMLM